MWLVHDVSVCVYVCLCVRAWGLADCRTNCDCDDGNSCTVDTCSTSTGKCVYTRSFSCESQGTCARHGDARP
jgi:hypothetical protein